MKTRDFRNDAEVAALVAAFERRTIPAAEFSHTAHIAVGLTYLANFPPDLALERMRQKIRNFAAHHGLDDLYHETLTTFWMRLLHHVATNCPPGLPLWRRVNLITGQWRNRRPVDAHYSKELIASAAAREKWTPPDLLPLPF